MQVFEMMLYGGIGGLIYDVISETIVAWRNRKKV